MLLPVRDCTTERHGAERRQRRIEPGGGRDARRVVVPFPVTPGEHRELADQRHQTDDRASAEEPDGTMVPLDLLELPVRMVTRQQRAAPEQLPQRAQRPVGHGRHQKLHRGRRDALFLRQGVRAASGDESDRLHKQQFRVDLGQCASHLREFDESAPVELMAVREFEDEPQRLVKSPERHARTTGSWPVAGP